LTLSHHVNHLDAGQGCSCCGRRLEALHWPDPPLDASMILLDPIIEVLTLADTDRLQRSPRPIP
jgi:hypothetical protein